MSEMSEMELLALDEGLLFPLLVRAPVPVGDVSLIGTVPSMVINV
jgi:hypothetical protein